MTCAFGPCAFRNCLSFISFFGSSSGFEYTTVLPARTSPVAHGDICVDSILRGSPGIPGRAHQYVPTKPLSEAARSQKVPLSTSRASTILRTHSLISLSISPADARAIAADSSSTSRAKRSVCSRAEPMRAMRIRSFDVSAEVVSGLRIYKKRRYVCLWKHRIAQGYSHQESSGKQNPWTEFNCRGYGCWRLGR